MTHNVTPLFSQLAYPQDPNGLTPSPAYATAASAHAFAVALPSPVSPFSPLFTRGAVHPPAPSILPAPPPKIFGKITYPNGSVYEGPISTLTHQPEGQGILISSDGSRRFEGWFSLDQFWGKVTCASHSSRHFGESVEGSFREGGFFGTQGIWIFQNGNIRYEGEVLDGIPHGKGRECTVNGNTYTGDFFNGLYHGRGKCEYPDHIIYEGEYVCNQRQGFGTLTLPTGIRVQGIFVKDQTPSNGKIIYSNGIYYEGEISDYLHNGFGKLVLESSTVFEGTWVDGAPVISSENMPEPLKNPQFLHWMLGHSVEEGKNPYPYLLYYPLAFFAAYFRMDSLQEAYRLVLLPPQESAENIARLLQTEGRKILYPYGSAGHVFGLEMEKQGNEIFLRIFNSGEGVMRYHKAHQITRKKTKHETQLVFKLPREFFTQETIRSLLEKRGSISTQEFYQTCLQLPGVERVDVLPPILHTMQKGGNCSTEWIFAYLKNTLPEIEYHTLRLELFRNCLRNMQAHEPKDRPLIRALEGKICVRKRKITQLRAQ